MRPGTAAPAAAAIALAILLVVAGRGGAEIDAIGQVRVLSPSDSQSTITLRVGPDALVDDRTTGAQPPSGPRGPASVGQTFAGEITLFLPDVIAPRQATVEPSDPVVSMVRVFPEHDGTTVVVFVRQPVSYTVSRPSALGEITIDVRSRRELARVVGVRGRRGQPRIKRPREPGREVAVDAESVSYDEQAKVVVARGSVTLTRGNLTLTADEVRYDKTDGTVDAVGHVVLNDPEATTEGDAAHIDLDDEAGWIDSASMYRPISGYTLTAGRLEKLGGPRYSVADGIFTTCECGGLERPSWSLKGRQTDVSVGGTGTVRGATFRVKDVPVFYLPWMLFPANNDRQTGLLVPRVGYSKLRGFQYEQPFYWAINKSMDATLGLDVETAARVGAVGEFRYYLSRKTRGQFGFAYYNERIGGLEPGILTGGSETPTGAPENRYLIAAEHVQPLPGGGKFYVDGLGVSDQTLLRVIDNFSFAARTRLAYARETRSTIGAIKTWRDGSVQLDTLYQQDLVDPQEFAQQRLPRLRVTHQLPLIEDHVYGRVAGEATEFVRQDGYDGVRGIVAPELFVPLRLGSAVFGSVSAQVRENLYHLRSQSQVPFVVPGVDQVGFFTDESNLQGLQQSPYRLPTLDRNDQRTFGIVSGRLGTEIARVFPFRHWGLERLRHSIEPEVRYLYVPQVSRPIFTRQLPDCATVTSPDPGNNCGTVFSEGFLYDNQDAINQRNFFSYGFTTRLLGRTATAAETAADAAADEAEEEGLVDDAEFEEADETSSVVTDPSPLAPLPVDRPGRRPPSRELLRASVLQGYDVSRDISLSGHLSDVDLGLRLTPLDYLVLSYGATVNFGKSRVQGQSVGFVIREPSWRPTSRLARLQLPTSVGISYSFVADSRELYPTNTIERSLLASPGVNFVAGYVYLRLSDYVGGAFLARYDLKGSPATTTAPAQDPGFVERDYLLHIVSRCNCWVFDFGVSDRVNPNETLFRAQITLVGLGSFGQGSSANTLAAFSPLGALGYYRGGYGGSTY